MESTIFIQIASYRDLELINTINDCINKSKYPENLRFCIAWQRDESENLDQFKNDSRFNILDIPFQQSKGACWARNLIQQNYNKEKYTLQLDSHHRFIQDWDEKCISTINKLQFEGYEKPILTTYLPSYDPEHDPFKRVNIPWKMDFDRFTPEGVVFFLPSSINDYHSLNRPIRARFYSAHFCFTLGQFAEEVQHDPEYYFHGEEISIAARAYTHGYDLFHPTELICWHEYTRKGRAKHWDDDKDWGNKNTLCHARNRKLLSVDNEINDIDFGKYGLGNKRSLEQYERYAGLCFKNRSVSNETLNHKEPADPDMSIIYEEWSSSLNSIFKHCIDLNSDLIDKNAEYLFWYVGLFDKDKKEIYRKDCDEQEVKQIMSTQASQQFYNIWRTCTPAGVPKFWKIIPYRKDTGWQQEIDGTI